MSKIFTVKDTAHAKQLSAKLRCGEFRRIHKGVYTDDLEASFASIVIMHWMEVVSYVVPSGILSHRTGLELKPYRFSTEQAIIYVTSSYTKTISLPGLTIKILKGNNSDYLEQVIPALSRSNLPRLLLENLVVVKSSADKEIKTVGADGIENKLAKELRIYGELHLNQIRDQAKIIAEKTWV